MGSFKPLHFSVKFGRLIHGSVPSSDVLFSTEVLKHCDVKKKNLIADMASDTRRYLSPILLFPSMHSHEEMEKWREPGGGWSARSGKSTKSEHT